MTTYSKPIICCGFTPCVQRILEYKKIEKGRVNRASRVTQGIGGKGANTARMVGQLGEKSLLLGFLGGPNGRLVEKMLEAEGVESRHVEVAGETRICQTLVEAGESETTELVEEMPPVSESEWKHMLALVQAVDADSAVVSICGKLPAGAPVDAYAQVISILVAKGGRVILDAPGEPMLCALAFKPTLVKINDVELFEAVGGDDIVEAAELLLKRGAQSVLITRGGQSAFFVDQDQQLEIFPPTIDAVNPVGSGDAVTAGMAVALSEGAELHDMLIRGMACGAANALNLVSGLLKIEDVEALRAQVVLKALV